MKIAGFTLVMLGFAVFLGVICGVPQYTKTCPPGVMPPLLVAILRDDFREAGRFLEQGADPNRGRPPFGNPFPLDAALGRGNVEMIVLLESYGAREREDFRAGLVPERE